MNSLSWFRIFNYCTEGKQEKCLVWHVFLMPRTNALRIMSNNCSLLIGQEKAATTNCARSFANAAHEEVPQIQFWFFNQIIGYLLT